MGSDTDDFVLFDTFHVRPSWVKAVWRVRVGQPSEATCYVTGDGVLRETDTPLDALLLLLRSATHRGAATVTPGVGECE